MIRKYRYGTPFDTEALTEKIETTESTFPYGEISQNDGFAFTYIMDEDDIVYGLGESNRGINKRGYCYISNCTDDPLTILLSRVARLLLDCFLTIRQN